MSIVRVLRDRLRALWRPHRVHDEIDEELRFHLEMRAAQNIASGVAPADAHEQARRAFGHVTQIKELAYDVRGGGILESIWQDVRYAVRGLRAKPALSLGIVLTLALGIGANTAMFAIVDRMLFRPPPYLIDPSTAHRVFTVQFRRGQSRTSNVGQYARYLDLSSTTHSFALTAAFAQQQLAVGVGEASREMLVGTVSASFFDFFAAPPAIGRYFSVSEDSPPTGALVVVLSYGTWQTEYGGRSNAIGSHIQIGSSTYTVIGVTPRGFVGVWPEHPASYWVPITAYAAGQAAFASWLANERWWRTYKWGWLSMIVRRKPGVTIAVADADLTSAMSRSLDAELAESSRTSTSRAVSPRAFVASVLADRGPNAGPIAKVSLWVAGVAVIVLLIAGANVANLLLARALRRRREIALRLALGVGTRRLVSQLLVESLVLAIIGGAAGMFIAQWGGALLRSRVLTDSAPTAVFSDSRALIMTIAVVAAIGLMTGLAPIAQTRRADLTRDLKAGAREGGPKGSRLRVSLLVFQAALSALLLVGAGLFVRSVRNVRAIRLGYDTEPILLVNLNMRGVRLDSARYADLRRRLVSAAATTPGVVHVAERNATPFISHKGTFLFVDGIDTVSRLGQFDQNDVSPDYFATVGTGIVRGRAFTTSDAPTAPRVMIVSQAMGERLWPGKDAIGQCVRVNADTMPCTHVVGVAENIRNQSLADDPAYYYYLPADQVAPTDGGLFVRVDGRASVRANGVRSRLQREMPGASYVTTTPFADVIGSQTASWTMGATTFTAFGILALIVAAIGLYSVIAYDVEQRTREVGVRVALGAQPGQLIVMVVRQGIAITLAGTSAGMVVALAAARWMEPLLFGESPRDPIVFGVVGGVLLGTAVASSWIPARRAARIDPQVALRSE
jgi:putative ABC transport system permease protein